ncbi:MAG: putative ABC exporter domain-containing protein [Gemmatimonadetes bacterium]|nr:putative ABC exporter domain-containing protein [Gemmatimonadota bacterium]
MTRRAPGALEWLAALETRNRLLTMAARLRDPRYLVALLFGLGYFVLLFSPQLFDPAGARMEPPPWALHVVPLLLAGLALFWWVRGGYEKALGFRPEEVHFLFTAPLTRSGLIRYKLLRAQGGLLISALLITILRPAALPWPLAFPAAWVMVTTLHLHQLGSSLVRVTAAQGGRSGIRRAALPLMVAAALAGVLIWTVGGAIRAARVADTLPAAGYAAMAALSSPLAEAALLPFVLLLRPLLAATAGEWALAMVGALALMALHLLWVLRTDAAFEEAGAEAGRLRAEMLAAARSGQGWWRLGRNEDQTVRRWLRPPLRPTGEPATALAWSQTLAFSGDIRPATLALVAASVAAVFAMLVWAAGSVAEAAGAAAGIAAVLVGMVFIFGPMALRYDLRRDLGRLELLRTFPLDPRWLVIGELAALVILLTFIELALLAAVALLVALSGAGPDVLATVLPVELLVAVNAPGLLTLQVAVQNGLALLFPGWVRIGAGAPPGGIDAVGQGILATLTALLALLIVLILPLLAAALVAAAYAGPLAGWSAIPTAMAFTGAVWLQAAWLVRGLGRAYDRLDPVESALLH